MTTVFGAEEAFWAADSRWTFKNVGRGVDDHQTRKVISAHGELTFFAGDEHPILVQQASILELISHDQYLTLATHLAGEEYEMLVVAESDGTIIDADLVNPYRCPRPKIDLGLMYLGSGGVHACDFFYYSHKKPYLSNNGCNIVGAMHYASHKDEATGGKVSYQVWQPGTFAGNISSPSCYLSYNDESYSSYVKGKIDYLQSLLEGNDMERLSASSAANGALASTMSSVAVSEKGSGLRKVSLSSEIDRLQRRLARRKEASKQG
ncbi:hypothetical protein ACET6W_12325 [Aeromonas veronii]|uniref:hypothetical protein n=1 Tax=Aeromonas veronii TaxID=654 RepID=UPI0035B99BA4